MNKENAFILLLLSISIFGVLGVLFTDSKDYSLGSIVGIICTWIIMRKNSGGNDE